jgi:hypothetical protein
MAGALPHAASRDGHLNIPVQQRGCSDRYVFHFTPLHASWVNQIELLFGIYARRVLRYASHSSIAQLRERTEAFMAQRNQAPKPFKWTFAGFELQTGEPRRFKHDANVRSTKKGR